MTNETTEYSRLTNLHDVEIARISAALAVLNFHRECVRENCICDEAEVFLAGQFLKSGEFSRVDPVQRQSPVNTRPSTSQVIIEPRCPKIRPGRNNKLTDALQCTKEAGHEGECAFMRPWPKQTTEE